LGIALSLALLCIIVPFYSFWRVIRWFFKNYAPTIDSIFMRILIGPIIYPLVFIVALIIYIVGFVYWFGKYSIKLIGIIAQKFFPSD
jgi:hypothetical protein